MIGTLPAPPAEPPVETSTDGLAPKFRARVIDLLRQMETMGFDPIIAESLRSDERQAWLYGFGREYDDGRGIVTNAPTGDAGWHKFGLAVDIVSDRLGWDAPNGFWSMLGVLAEQQGLAWGGAWPKFPDRPHVQHGAPMRRSPSAQAGELFRAGGYEAVWRAVDAI